MTFRVFDDKGDELQVTVGPSSGFSIDADGRVREWQDDEELDVSPLRAAELLGTVRIVLGEDISDAAGLPKIGNG